MLGLVAYNLVFAQHLPQLGYLSLADAFFLFCLVGVFVGHGLLHRGLLRLESLGQEERATRLRRGCAWLLPVLQAVSLGALLVLWT